MSGFIDMKAPAVIPPDERISSSSVPHPQAHFDKPVTYHTDDLNSVSFLLIVHLQSLPFIGDPLEVIEGNNSSPLFMRPTSFVIGEERSMMNSVLAGRDEELCTGMGLVITPFANNVCV